MLQTLTKLVITCFDLSSNPSKGEQSNEEEPPDISTNIKDLVLNFLSVDQLSIWFHVGYFHQELDDHLLLLLVY